MAPPAPRIDVIAPDGQVIRLTGRVARLVLWLCEHAERIDIAGKGELSIMFGRENLTARFVEFWDNIA